MQTLQENSDVVVYIKSLLNEGFSLPYYNIVRLLEVYNYSLYDIKFIEPENGEENLTLSNIYEKKEGIVLTIFEKSWADYLPLVYKNTQLKEFLYGFQLTMFKHTETIDRVEELFIPEKTPDELVSWLGEWFNISFSDEIKLENRKRVLYRLTDLYNLKGTKRYLIEMVKLLTDIEIEIKERETVEDDLITVNKNLSFVVSIKKEAEYQNLKEHKKMHHIVKNIIETEKPIFAYAHFDNSFKFDIHQSIIEQPIIQEQEVIYKEEREEEIEKEETKEKSNEDEEKQNKESEIDDDLDEDEFF
jgi:phage tail-like protein